MSSIALDTTYFDNLFTPQNVINAPQRLEDALRNYRNGNFLDFINPIRNNRDKLGWGYDKANLTNTIADQIDGRNPTRRWYNPLSWFNDSNQAAAMPLDVEVDWEKFETTLHADGTEALTNQQKLINTAQEQIDQARGILSQFDETTVKEAFLEQAHLAMQTGNVDELATLLNNFAGNLTNVKEGSALAQFLTSTGFEYSDGTWKAAQNLTADHAEKLYNVLFNSNTDDAVKAVYGEIVENVFKGNIDELGEAILLYTGTQGLQSRGVIPTLTNNIFQQLSNWKIPGKRLFSWLLGSAPSYTAHMANLQQQSVRASAELFQASTIREAGRTLGKNFFSNLPLVGKVFAKGWKIPVVSAILQTAFDGEFRKNWSEGDVIGSIWNFGKYLLSDFGALALAGGGVAATGAALAAIGLTLPAWGVAALTIGGATVISLALTKGLEFGGQVVANAVDGVSDFGSQSPSNVANAPVQQTPSALPSLDQSVNALTPEAQARVNALISDIGLSPA